MICSTCGSADFRFLYQLPDGGIVRCRKCNIVSRAVIISGDDALKLYDDDDYLNSTYFEALKNDSDATCEPYRTYLHTLEKLERKVSERRLLDIGCSYGAFLKMAAARGWEVAGVEISKKACEYAHHERRLNVFNGTLRHANYADAIFSVVTLWDVIEHVDRPLELLREIRRILIPNGIVVLFTINQKSLMNRIGHAIYVSSFGKVARPLALLYDVHHNYFFDCTSLLNLLRKAGLAGHVEVEWMDAKIERWQTIPIPRLLALGSKCIDLLSRLVGMRYRMIMLASPGDIDTNTILPNK